MVVPEVLRTSQQHDHHRNPNPIPSCKQVIRNALREEVTILEDRLTKSDEPSTWYTAVFPWAWLLLNHTYAHNLRVLVVHMAAKTLPSITNLEDDL